MGPGGHGSSLGNNLWQKCKVRLRTIHPCGGALPLTLRIAEALVHRDALFSYGGNGAVVVVHTTKMLKVRFFGLLGNKNMPIKKPREQVADAEALFDLARTLVTSVRSHNTDGITPYMFSSSLLRVYGSQSAKRHTQNANTLRWKKISLAVSPIFTPRDGPAARLVMSGEVKYNHFVFRLDFADWELMKKVVPEGEELMPNRVIMASPVFTEANKPDKDTLTNPVFTEAYKLVPVDDSRLRLRISRVKKMSRNHGKVIREASDIDNSPEIGDANIGNGSLKRKLL
ncbi:Non-structural maintenance of chromosomes element 4 -like protein B [Capsicum chinense]|nr:Non-structural maintenance of chromosomes element 4 -like protein B [Capsicum chinense]